jgi:hypothetical protein
MVSSLLFLIAHFGKLDYDIRIDYLSLVSIKELILEFRTLSDLKSIQHEALIWRIILNLLIFYFHLIQLIFK